MTKTQSSPPRSADQILPHQLPSALERAPDAVKLLSLDCFDTLLWRDVHAPSDLFSCLPDVMVQQRVAAEANARKAMLTRRRRNEVCLQDIYAQAFPELGGTDRRDERDAAIHAELSAEAQVCFAFTPTVELMQEAKARGLKVIIVSDTYLSAAELRGLIKASAGDEVLALIDRIFVSSEAGFSKAEGLLGHALKAMKMRAHQTLHIGDNPKADYDGARALGIPALHLVQFEETAKQRLRLERACAQLTGEMAGQETQAPEGLQPHRAILALEEPRISDPAERLGFTVLGPLMAAYERWLRCEAMALAEKHGGTVHWLFMMRDGHLPHLVHQAFNEAVSEAPPSSARIEISRFTATAASLTSRAAYDEQVALEFGLNPSTLARQMLLEADEIEAIVGDPRNDSELVDASFRLLDALKDGKRQKTTMRRARQMAERLVAHVKANLNIASGDVLMLVDLGYNGSAQNGVDALLSEALGVHVAGRYLLCREKTVSGLDKTGMLDPQHYPPGLLEALAGNVAVIEQLATCAMGSVTGYEEDGTPIRKESSVKGKQSQVRDRVQDGVVRFARVHGFAPVTRVADFHADAAWTSAAASLLTRFMFLPQPAELDVVKSFEHDVNLGSDRMVALFDTKDGRESMQRRGLFYMKGSPRMYLPAELAEEDMSTRLALLVQKRFGLGLTYSDYAPRSISIPALYLGAVDGSQAMIEARPTHDGYYVARLPVGEQVQAVALQMGAALGWVEIASVSRSRLESLKSDDLNEAPPVRVAVEYDGMEERADGLFECTRADALMMMRSSASATREGAQVIEIVLRPLAKAKPSARSHAPSPTRVSPQEAAA